MASEREVYEVQQPSLAKRLLVLTQKRGKRLRQSNSSMDSTIISLRFRGYWWLKLFRVCQRRLIPFPFPCWTLCTSVMRRVCSGHCLQYERNYDYDFLTIKHGSYSLHQFGLRNSDTAPFAAIFRTQSLFQRLLARPTKFTSRETSENTDTLYI
jgi:hypothetical protein